MSLIPHVRDITVGHNRIALNSFTNKQKYLQKPLKFNLKISPREVVTLKILENYQEQKRLKNNHTTRENNVLWSRLTYVSSSNLSFIRSEEQSLKNLVLSRISQALLKFFSIELHL